MSSRASSPIPVLYQACRFVLIPAGYLRAVKLPLARISIAIVLMPFDHEKFMEDCGEWTLEDVFDSWWPCHDELL